MLKVLELYVIICVQHATFSILLNTTERTEKKEQINKNEAKKNYPKKNTSYWQAVVRHTSAVHAAAAAAVGSVHRREEKKKKK